MLFDVERFADVSEEIKPLLERHYEEISLSKNFPLQPNWALYEKLDSDGKLCIVTAREEGLAGYAIFLVVPHLHYQTMKIAQNDVVFIDQEHRKGTTGIKLIAYAEHVLEGLGVNKIFWHVKKDHDWGAILARRGYVGEEVNWAKSI